MYEKDGYPESSASTGLPVGIMLLSAIIITAYLVVGSAMAQGGGGTVAYLPEAHVQ
ncbi:hypothetical protein [Ensifer sp.]|jgi:hypothetical protein|uniref:hypothetical protein n=1 Tax=Ensifer sp. TaxID=1872086 RepID=UPI002E0F32B0|nr:hypothetical protein [Ensifer sp.]